MTACVSEWHNLSDTQKLDKYFYQDTAVPARPKSAENRHTRLIRLAKLLLPGTAALLISLLLIFPNLKQQAYDIRLYITRPKSGELEKLHMEKTTFYITDKNNRVTNLTAANIDETSPGSKLIKLNRPEGIIPNGDTTWINIKSPTGFFNQTENVLRLTDGVEMFYSDGMTVNTFEAEFNFTTSVGSGRSHVSGQGIFGDIEAEGFDLYNKTGVLVFIGPADLKIREESFKSEKQ